MALCAAAAARRWGLAPMGQSEDAMGQSAGSPQMRWVCVPMAQGAGGASRRWGCSSIRLWAYMMQLHAHGAVRRRDYAPLALSADGAACR